MQCYTELIAPSAVSHAVSLHFLSSTANNLVVAKTSLLQLFELRTVATDASSNARRDGHAGGDQNALEGFDAYHRTENTSKLVLIGEYPLSGSVTALASVKALNTKSGGEALLVSTEDAKMSLIDWDPDNHRISTISIHYYEGDNILARPFGPALADCGSYLSVDPSSRCAALKFGANHLAILPFRQLGDDLVEAEYDPDLDTPPLPPVSGARSADQEPVQNGTATQNDTPYSSSFVLPLTALDPALTHPVHLAFLHEYREPTFGIVSSSSAASNALLEERKDPLSYTVFTLDLEQRASTTLLSVTGLPFDIFRVLPLPLPVGGALLVGTNQLIHVDQAGKTNAVAVNEFARQCSNFSMLDQSNLAMRLEDCVIETLDSASGDMLVVLNTGQLAILAFRIDGRSVSGLSVTAVDPTRGGRVMSAAPNCAATVARGKIFLGSDEGDSTLLGWTKKTAQISRKRSHAQMLAEDADLSLDEDDLDDDADDDLYGDESVVSKRVTANTTETNAPESYGFRIHDTLLSIGPINAISMGRNISSITSSGVVDGIAPPLSLLAGIGRQRSSKLAFLNRELTPSPIRTVNVPSAHSVWSVCAKHAAPRGLPKPEQGEQSLEAQLIADDLFDQYLITHHIEQDGTESSKVFRVDNAVSSVTEQDRGPAAYEEVTGTEFDGDGETLDVGTLASGTRVIQVRKHDVKSYDADLGLSQIFPILDEATDDELAVVHSSFCDPYLLLLREDSSLQILEMDSSGDLDQLDQGDVASSTKWLSGCIYKSEVTGDKALAFMLDADGGLAIFELPKLDKPVYTAPSLSVLPPVLSSTDAPRRAAGKETLTELLFADLGDAAAKSPYLILRSATDDLTLYEPFHHPAVSPTSLSPFTTNLRFRKVPGMHLPKYNEDASLEKPTPLRALTNVGGCTAVFMAGGSPSFILKDATSLPHIVNLRGNGVRGLCGFNSRKCEAGFAYIDTSGTLREGQLPAGTTFSSNGWSVRKISPFPTGYLIQNVGYHSEQAVYVVVTKEEVDFSPPGDDHKHPAADEDINLRPKTSKYHVHIYDPQADAVIHTYDIPAYEIVTSMEVAPLEISEVTHKQKLLVAVGTISQRGENFAAKGVIYVLDIIPVVPEPSRPETGKKLHVFSREEIKGGITALMGIAGLVGAAQGQKLMFRGLREDGSCLPVAFLDAQCYITSLKTLGSTRLWLAADAWKGLWFGGFNEEPYKITLFGKSRSQMEVLAADFLPFEGQLYLVVIDAELDMHVLQYDPEHPKSLSGQRLLHRSTFHIGHLPTSMTLLPSTLSPFTAQPLPVTTTGNDSSASSSSSPTPPADASPSPSLHHVLVTHASGAVSLLTPLDEATYRRLAALQTSLASILEHPAGLNPRAHRSVVARDALALSGSGASAGVVDGDVVCRVAELGVGKRIELLGRVGVDAWGLRSDAEIVAGGGLAYL
ncbi:hypothetical protein MBLNU459_g5108t1 [Dothideomycetes sp. NU459]